MKNIFTFLFLSSFLLPLQLEAQTLQSYIEEAELNNPTIQAFDLRYKIAQEKVNQTDWLPNTEFGLGYFVSEPETRTGAQRARFSVRQMLPWFGTIAVRENYASSMAETEFVDITIAKRKLALNIAQNYYRLYEIRAKQLVLEENKQLLETYEQLALNSVTVGKASAVDVLRLQIRQNEIQQQKEVLEETFISEQVAFNNLLSREGNLVIQIYDSLVIPQEDSLLSSGELSLNPELLKFDKLYESVAKSELLNQIERKPTLGFGLDYIPVSERPAMDFSDNGKDILMPMVTLSVPIFNNRYQSVSKQNQLRQQEIQTQKQERLNVLETALANAISNRNQARIRHETQTQNLKQAKDAEKILIKNYETGTIDFNDVLDIQELQLRFQLKQAEAVREYYEQSAVVNYLIY